MQRGLKNSTHIRPGNPLDQCSKHTQPGSNIVTTSNASIDDIRDQQVSKTPLTTGPIMPTPPWPMIPDQYVIAEGAGTLMHEGLSSTLTQIQIHGCKCEAFHANNLHRHCHPSTRAGVKGGALRAHSPWCSRPESIPFPRRAPAGKSVLGPGVPYAIYHKCNIRGR